MKLRKYIWSGLLITLDHGQRPQIQFLIHHIHPAFGILKLFFKFQPESHFAGLSSSRAPSVSIFTMPGRKSLWLLGGDWV